MVAVTPRRLARLSLRLLAGLCLLLPGLAAAQDPAREGEVRIKAAFLSKFGDFVEWPPAAFRDAGTPFVIAVMGSADVAAELERVARSRVVQARPVAVRRLRRGERLEGVHVLFVGAAEEANLGEILAAAAGRPVLTVTESEGALEQGSMINFIAAEDKVRFDIALPAAELGQLRISARLLGVARKVVPG